MWETVDICHFFTPVLMNMSNITFEVARSDSCVFKKCLEKIIFTIIFLIRLVFKGFWVG